MIRSWKIIWSKAAMSIYCVFMQPFFAFRALVVASPLWYPNLDRSVREKLFNFIDNVLDAKEFDYQHVNDYFERR